MRKCDFCKHNGICSFKDITNCAIRDYIHFEMEESTKSVESTKCSDCQLRHQCDKQTEFICKENDFCKYIKDSGNHGHWEVHYICSKCGETIRTALAECPCCHTRMDGLDI